MNVVHALTNSRSGRGSTGQVAFFRNLFYAICIAILLLGLFIMDISITWKMRYDQYSQDYSYGGD
ncbi:hypothetical protein [Methanoculleus sp. UBA430]|uniref:hypothetical protein n=1 Tax=Methanoculleus sp. UBA430 TaxID=1915511 RepID=UPI0025FDE1D6|nr:hypothetical protein [Methanoculleus sp. UBA430]